jgi:Tol biopolymer transport system component
MIRTVKSTVVLALLSVPILLSGACGDSNGPDPEPTTGFIQASTSTSGADLDPDGYTVSMDGNSGRSIGLNGVITFTDVPTGAHQVQLSGLADNCWVSGANPAGSSVAGSATAQVSFVVMCAAFTGSLQVTTAVTNNLDPNGFEVRVDGLLYGPVAVNSAAEWRSAAAGVRSVELTDIAANCVVGGPNPKDVTIEAGQTTSATFDITCTDPPDGRILISRYDPFEKFMLSVMNADGSGMIDLVQAGFWSDWSPDGGRIVFSRLGQGDWDLHVMNKDASGVTQLTFDTENWDAAPAWSPDGSQIAFAGGAEPGQIFVIGVDGSGRTQLTAPDEGSNSPSWSPDGSMIAYSHSTSLFLDSDTRIYVMNADGTGSTPLTAPAPVCGSGWNVGNPQWQDTWPNWSPDGSRILFMRDYNCDDNPNNNYRAIFVMNPDGTDAVELVIGPSPPTFRVYADWSPDGARIVYIHQGETVYVMNADGTGRTLIRERRGGWSFEGVSWGW